jgi:hypothetical protein
MIASEETARRSPQMMRPALRFLSASCQLMKKTERQKLGRHFWFEK